MGIGDRENANATPKSEDMEIADAYPWGKQWPPPDDAGTYSERSARQPPGWPSLRRRDVMPRVGQLSKDLTMGRCLRKRQEASARTDSASMIWEGMSGSGARTNMNRARPFACCEAVHEG